MDAWEKGFMDDWAKSPRAGIEKALGKMTGGRTLGVDHYRKRWDFEIMNVFSFYEVIYVLPLQHKHTPGILLIL